MTGNLKDRDLVKAAIVEALDMANSTTNKHFRLHGEVKWIFMTLTLIMGMAIICLNSLTIYVILKKRSLHTLSNMFIVSLAICDVLDGMCLFLVAATYEPSIERNLLVRHPRLCAIFKTASPLLTLVSVIHLTVISIDRCVFFKAPYFYNMHFNAKRAFFICVVMWVFSMMYVTYPHVTLTRAEAVTVCVRRQTLPKEYVVYANNALYISSLIVITVMYSIVLRIVLKKRRSKSDANRISMESSSMSFRGDKTKKSVGSSCGAFSICFESLRQSVETLDSDRSPRRPSSEVTKPTRETDGDGRGSRDSYKGVSLNCLAGMMKTSGKDDETVTDGVTGASRKSVTIEQHSVDSNWPRGSASSRGSATPRIGEAGFISRENNKGWFDGTHEERAEHLVKAVHRISMTGSSLTLKGQYRRERLGVLHHGNYDVMTQRPSQRSSLRTVKFYGIMFGAFFFIITPSLVVSTVAFYTPIPAPVYSAVLLAADLNCLANFFIFFTFNPAFRKRVKRTLRFNSIHPFYH